MTVTEEINPLGSGRSSLDQNSENARDAARLKRATLRVRQSLTIGGLYIAWACWDSISTGMGTLGHSFDVALFNAGVFALAFGIPTLCMRFRRGVFSAAFLSIAAMYGVYDHLSGVAEDAPRASVEFAILHFLFMFGFIRSAVGARMLRRLQKTR